MYGRDRQVTIDWLRRKFADHAAMAQANVAALNAGHAFGETAEMSEHLVGYTVASAPVAPGRYRTVSGTEAIAWGLLAGMRAAGLEKMIFAGYPITPASLLLHTLAALKSHGVITFQAEDEIAAIGAAIGAAYAGALGVTSSSGPGIALKTEMLGLAIATELPIVVVDSQRAGPSTGMPTKTEQSDLFQAVHGRNADAPLAVIAAATAADCFEVAIEAVRIATKYMTPVILLSDGYLAHAAEPWRLPDLSALPRFPVHFRTDPAGFHPFLRDPVTLARAWAVPGTPNLEHRIGGLEKDYDTGHISYDPDNHARMTSTRAAKIAGIAHDIPPQQVALGDDHGAVAVVGWGSTYGAIHRAVHEAREDGLDVAHIHLRYLNPFPRNLGDLLKRFDRILVPEMNSGQLVQLLRAAYLVPAEGLSKVEGKPFKVAEIVEAIESTVPRKP
jgi:2-oxoglutarate ferredoxin oxidoreductase subunit alpha